MRRYGLLCIAILALVVVMGCSRDQITAPDETAVTSSASRVTIDPAVVAAEIVARAGWELDPEVAESSKTGAGGTAGQTGGSPIVNWSDREVLVDDIVHYYFEIQVGGGPYDKIGLHRVVREGRGERPIRTKNAIFFQHGALVGFSKFIFGSTSPNTADDHSVAVFLAQNDVDVWGIDQNWVLVPDGVADLSFMAEWGLQNQVDNLRVGVATARFARTLTGSGNGKMHLLGYSIGVATGYAYLNEESQQPPGLRHVAGYIGIEGTYKVPGLEFAACQLAAGTGDLLNQGIYHDATGQLMNLLGVLAQTDPDGASAVFPGLTNLQAALAFGTTHQDIGGHFFAGVFDGGVPTGLRYTTVPGYLDFLVSAAPYWPVQYLYDYQMTACEAIDLPFDDHLSDITVPVLSFSAAGGYSWLVHMTLQTIGSTDVTVHHVQLLSDEEANVDIGHVDIWTGQDSPTLVWQPLLVWINDHTPIGSSLAGHVKN